MVAKAQKRGEIATRKEVNAFVVPASVSGIDPERELIFHYPHQYRVEDQDDIDFMSAVRKGDWKLVYRMHTGELELYNLRDDIGERNDLAASHPERVAELAKALGDRLRAWKAPMNCKNPGRRERRPRSVDTPAFDTTSGFLTEKSGRILSEPFRQAERRAERSSGYAEARNGRKKFNHFVKPSAEPNAVRAIPRREMEERNSTISSSRAQSRTKFGLYRGEKWSMQTNESARPTEVRRRLCYSIPSNRQMKRTATG